MAEISASNSRLVCVGQFGASYAVQGWVKLQSFTQPAPALFDYQPWYIAKQRRELSETAINAGAEDNAELRTLKLTSQRQHGRGFVVKLDGFDTPEQAQTLAGKSLYVSRAQLPPLTDGEYYWVDLIGLRVENLAGRCLGYVEEMMETGANDVLVINPQAEINAQTSRVTLDQHGKQEPILIPYVKDHYIVAVELDAGRIRVDWDWDEE